MNKAVWVWGLPLLCFVLIHKKDDRNFALAQVSCVCMNMAMHLQKLSVGSEGIDTLAEWQRIVVRRRKARGKSAVHEHVTRMFPKQGEALLDGGSIYWVIKGQIQCRNKIIGLEEVRGGDGIRRCSILMEPGPIAVIPAPRRPFQGWRYLKPEDAPADLNKASGGIELPAALRSKLTDLGAW